MSPAGFIRSNTSAEPSFKSSYVKLNVAVVVLQSQQRLGLHLQCLFLLIFERTTLCRRKRTTGVILPIRRLRPGGALQDTLPLQKESVAGRPRFFGVGLIT